MGFNLSEKMLKRAGLDYWPRLDVTTYADYDDFLTKNPDARIFYATTKAKHRYTDVSFQDGDYIMFGRESAGMPEEVLVQHPEECIRIPMKKEERSLNLSNSAAIILYEALRQLDFPELEDEGELHKLNW
jgi:tRNA (cytidine/uridine-2'-O-)-methyltransferase